MALELVTNLKNNLESIPSTIIEPFTQWLEQGIHYSGAWLCITHHKFREASLYLDKLEDSDKRNKTRAVLVEQETNWFEGESKKIEHQCKILQKSWSLEKLINLLVNIQSAIQGTSNLSEESCKTFLTPFGIALNEKKYIDFFKDDDLSEESRELMVQLGRILQSLWCNLLEAGINVKELDLVTFNIEILSWRFQDSGLIKNFSLPENKESTLCQSRLV